jgi:hypothetical protein
MTHDHDHSGAHGEHDHGHGCPTCCGSSDKKD